MLSTRRSSISTGAKIQLDEPIRTHWAEEHKVTLRLHRRSMATEINVSVVAEA